MTGKISPRACGRRSDANNAPKAACAGDRGFETGQKTGAILENSRLNNSSKAARRRPLNRGCEKTRVMIGSWRMKGHDWQPSEESEFRDRGEEMSNRDKKEPAQYSATMLPF